MNREAQSSVGVPVARRVVALSAVAIAVVVVLVLVVFRPFRGSAEYAASSGSNPTISPAADSPDAFRAVAAFELTERSGRKVTQGDLLGKPWIAGFVFTRCTGPCPRISASMKRLHSELVAASDAVRLVTFSLDPAFDTPAVLAQYADALGASAERWWFLTGAEADVFGLVRSSFMLPVEIDEAEPPGTRVTHRTVLAVVDARGVVRGYYDGETNEGADQALARARFLAQEKRP